MAGNYVYSKRAATDLQKILVRGIQEFGFHQASSYKDKIESTLQKLANSELHGLDRSDLRAGLRSILTGNEIIFFKVLANGDIRIVRVLGQKMDYKKVFK